MNPPQSEKRFILKCLRKLVTSQSLGLIPDANSLRKLDWNWIIDSCNTQRVLGFITFILKETDLMEHLDREIQQALQEGQLQCEMKNRLRREQFQVVSEILNRKKLAVMPLKGAALTHLIYNDLPFREMFDIDVLVQESHLNEAFGLLRDAGFRRRDAPVSKNRWHRSILAETITSQERMPIGRIPLAREDLQLDLHFNPKYRVEQKYVKLDVTGIWQRSVPYPQLGPNVRMLSPHDQFSYLLLHAVELFSPRLVQILDIALITERYRLSADPFADHVYVDLPCSSRLSLEAFYKTIKELFGEEEDILEFSPETSGMLDRFFSRSRVPNIMPEVSNPRPDQAVGAQVLKNISSFRKRLLFIAGYFLPCPEYYKDQSVLASHFRHWQALISKSLKLISDHEAVKGKDHKSTT